MIPETVTRIARWLLAIGLFAVSAVMPGSAWAYWSAGGNGVGNAETASVAPPRVTAASPALSDRVRVTWEPAGPPDGMRVLGYRVSRSDGRSTVDACRTSATNLLGPDVLECLDTDLPDGTFTYTVTADLGSWTESGDADPVAVAADRTGPQVRLGGTAGTNAIIDRRSGVDLLFFRPGAAGGGAITLTAEVTDDGVGPASATFPAVTTTRWSHAAETVTTGSGSGATMTYVSSPVSFQSGAAVPPAIVVTAADNRSNVGTATLTVVADSTAPTGGTLRVNGVNAADAATTSNATGDFVINAVTPYAEDATSTASGLASSTLVRESAPISNGTCGAFGGSATIDGAAPITQSGLSTGCYRYTLTGTDNVGNTVALQTVVELDTSAPDSGALTVNATDAVPAGVSSTSKTTSWGLSRSDFTDADSGMTSSTLTRTSANLTGGACGAFGTATTLTGAPAQTGLTTGCYRYRLVGTNQVGLTSTVETTVLLDTVAPTGGAFSIGGTAAAATPPSSTSTSSSVTITGLTAYTDANIGIGSSSLTSAYAPMSAGTCGTYGGESPVGGTGTFTVTGLADGCYRFTLTGTDLAGNTVSIGRIVRVDTSAPVGGVLTVNAVDGTTAGSTSTAAVGTWTATWTLFNDPESGVTANTTLARSAATMTNGVCGTFGTATNVFNATTPATGTSTQTGLTTNCYRYVLTTTNAFGLAATLTTIVKLDTTAATAGAMTVNAVAASAAGSSSTNGTGSLAVTVTSNGADTNSGSTVALVRTQSTVAASVCGTTFDTPVTLTYTLSTALTDTVPGPGCYRYTLTVTNGVGTLTKVLSTVRVDTTVPVGGALTVNGVDATTAGSTSTATVASYTIARTDWSDPETTSTSVLTRASATLAGGVCGTFGAATTLTGTTQTAPTTNCYRYVLTGTNPLVGPNPTLTTIVMLDTSAPTSGAFTVGGAVASAAGTQANLAAGSNFSVTAFTNYAETQTVLTSSTFTRTTGVSTAGVCGNYNASTTVTLTNGLQTQNGLPNGCYRYQLTGVNSFGLTASVIATVRVGP